MNSDTRRTLEALKSGEITVDEAMLAIKKEPFADIGYAKVDLHRGIRQGAAEVIYGAGKTAAQMIGILGVMLKNGVKTILITRLSPESAAKIQEVYRRSTTVRASTSASTARCRSRRGSARSSSRRRHVRHPRGRGGCAHRRGTRQRGCAAL